MSTTPSNPLPELVVRDWEADNIVYALAGEPAPPLTCIRCGRRYFALCAGSCWRCYGGPSPSDEQAGS